MICDLSKIPLTLLYFSGKGAELLECGGLSAAFLFFPGTPISRLARGSLTFQRRGLRAIFFCSIPSE